MEPPPPSVSTTRLPDPGRGPALVAMLVLAFVAAAVGSSVLTAPAERPTGSGGMPANAEPGRSLDSLEANRTASGLPSPSSTPEPSLSPGELTCLPAGWRLAYAGSMASWAVETWLAIEPTPASGPLDATIPIAKLGRDVVSGLGACAPPNTGIHLGRPAVVEHAWRVVRAGSADVARPIPLALAGAATVPVLRPDTLALVRPSDSSDGWASGEYVLQLAYPEPVGQVRPDSPTAWLRIEVDSPSP